MRAWNGSAQSLLGWIGLAELSEIGRPETPLSVFQADGWWLWVPCPHCGGYQLPLAANSADAALQLAHQLRLETCLSCQAQQQAAASPEGAIWFDPHQQQWVLATKVGTSSVIVPLGIKIFDHQQAQAAAQTFHEAWATAIPIIDRAENDQDRTIGVSPSPNGWRVWLPCEQCGGFALSLAQVTEQFDAQQAAVRVFDQHRAGGCLNCRAREHRQTAQPAQPAHAWFDVQRSEWMAWFPLDNGAVELPLEVYDISARELARYRHMQLLSAGSLLVPCQSQPAHDIPSLTCQNQRYQLHMPCSDCGVVSVPFGSGHQRHIQQRADSFLRALGKRCLACEAAEYRQATTTEPQVWFDPQVRDWILARYADGIGRMWWRLGVPDPSASTQTISFAASDLLPEE